MMELECKACGSKDTFIATCLYKYLLNSKGEEITTPEWMSCRNINVRNAVQPISK